METSHPALRATFSRKGRRKKIIFRRSSLEQMHAAKPSHRE
jgi:hypothetical protein